jgi:hypothetical protein
MGRNSRYWACGSQTGPQWKANGTSKSIIVMKLRVSTGHIGEPYSWPDAGAKRCWLRHRACTNWPASEGRNLPVNTSFTGCDSTPIFYDLANIGSYSTMEGLNSLRAKTKLLRTKQICLCHANKQRPQLLPTNCDQSQRMLKASKNPIRSTVWMRQVIRHPVKSWTIYLPHQLSQCN